jgi:hypothetical protein
VGFLSEILVVCVDQCRGFGSSIKFLIRFVVYCVDFSSIIWLHCVGVGASVINIA